MNSEMIKQGKILQTIGQVAKYHIYQTTSIESLENKELIGIANSYQEACRVIKEFLALNRAYQDPYWRFVMGTEATFVDYGSWTKWMAIVPPVAPAEMEGAKE